MYLKLFRERLEDAGQGTGATRTQLDVPEGEGQRRGREDNLVSGQKKGFSTKESNC